MRKILLSAIAVLSLFQARADEGMWLLPLLKQQNAQMMQQRGLELEIDDIYNPDSISLKDAVVRFGRGCTGEVISPDGLVLTNHHCGYSYIQNHSSVGNDLLTDGYWAGNRSEELPNEKLTVTFIDRIDDVTEYVTNELEADTSKNELSFLSPTYLNKLAKKKVTEQWLSENPGIEVEIKPFYNGNKYYMFTTTVYSDIRLVGTPPSSIGKFGADTDNWMWPRHTGDFSLFRIYADKNGRPAEYSADNVPLKVKKFFNISLKGVQQDDFAMVIGFPGRTNRFYTAEEVEERRDSENDVRVKVRDVRQQIMLDAMLKDPATKIQYASKYASSTNSYKSSKGMNKMINSLGVVDIKRAEQDSLIEWSKTNNHPEYIQAISDIQSVVDARRDLRRRQFMLTETFNLGIEFYSIPTNNSALIESLKSGKKDESRKNLEQLESDYKKWNNKNYNPSLDKNIAGGLIAYYMDNTKLSDQPDFCDIIRKQFKGDINRYIDNLFENSIFGSDNNFTKFTSRPSASKLSNDPMVAFSLSVRKMRTEVDSLLKDMDNQMALATKTYVKGLMQMREGTPMYPDANSTLRLTFGNIAPLKAADAINYDFATTMDGIMEKEDPDNWEFVVPARLKQLYLDKDFGKYKREDGKMPVCFIANTHSTGGNSGSPCVNGRGELIGTGFDRNWEGIGGDIKYQPRYQRTICVDIRYTLFIIEKYGNAHHLIDEMVIVD